MTNTPSRYEPHLRVGLIVYAIALFATTHYPLPLPLEVADINYDKLLHVATYALLGILALAWRRSTGAVVGLHTRLVIFTLVVSFGALDELTQPLVNRVCDPIDWIADLCGALLAVYFDAWRYNSH